MVLLSENLATTFLDPKSIEAFVACSLIALNKNPGFRPIDVGEILCWKCLIAITSGDEVTKKEKLLYSLPGKIFNSC